MTEYKLVPFEPTPEMVSAAEDAYMPFGDMDLALRMAILAAPDVQGEAVAWLYEEDGSESSIRTLRQLIPSGSGWKETPLYASPQPADSADVRQDKQCRQDVAAALGFPCGGNYAWSYLLQQIKDAVSTGEKQPDVTRLVEELEVLLVSGHLPRTWKERLSILLAAHRKGAQP